MEPATIEKRNDGKLWIITIHIGNREGVDAWEQCVRQYIAEANNSSERYLIYDTTASSDVGFTRYLQQRATVLANDNPDATGRVAIVLGVHSIVASFFDMFIRVVGSRIQPKLAVKIFSQREEAINWVSEIMSSEAEVNL